MSSFARLLGLAVVILLLFLVTAFVAQGWLHREHLRAQHEATETRRQQFQAALQLISPHTLINLRKELPRLNVLLDASITLQSAELAPPEVPNGSIIFREPIPLTGQQPDIHAIIAYQLPRAAQLGLLHGRTWGLLLAGALIAVFMFILLGLLFTRRPTTGGGSRAPWAMVRSEMNSLEHIAKTSADRGTQLAMERDNRLRIEDNLNLTQQLQKQVFDEKIRLGRDLHDDVIQSLYAVGLTLEAARVTLETDPSAADQQIQQCLDRLNASIRDVRGYIKGLSPDKLRKSNFQAALKTLAGELEAGREIGWEQIIDEDATAALSFEQTTEALQISREAISNALRHGAADQITIRLHRNDSEVGLLISDNGHGFHMGKNSSEGHGLTNMQGRATQIGATLRIDSSPETGTRIVVTFPVNPVSL